MYLIAYFSFTLLYCTLLHCETGMKVINEEFYVSMCNKNCLYNYTNCIPVEVATKKNMSMESKEMSYNGFTGSLSLDEL